MENFSHSQQPNKSSTSVSKKSCNGTNFMTKTSYDDVFGGSPKFRTPTLAPRVDDYTEIFGGFHASRASSIPVLDLPVVDEDDVFFDVQSSGFDYNEVFGGFGGLDFAVSFEELMMDQSNGINGDVDSCEDAWTPAESDSLSVESDKSGKNQSFSNRDSCESIDGGMEFKISFHKSNQRSDEDMSSGITHVTQIHAVPGYTFLVDKTTPLGKANYENPPLEVTDDSNLHMDFGGGIIREKSLMKTLSQPSAGSSGEQAFANGPKPQRAYGRNSSLPNKPFVTVSEISLRTQPSEVPPPCRPAPLLDINKGDPGKIAKYCKTTASEGIMSDTSPPFYDVEVDACSSAAASAAAMKEVMEKAQAKLKTAKELLERKREGVQSRKHDRKEKERNMFGTVEGSSTIKEERVHGTCERKANGMPFSVREERQRDSRTKKAVPDSLEAETIFNVDKTLAEKHGRSGKIVEAGEWKEATEFFELVQTDRTTLEQANYDEVELDAKVQDCRQKIKEGAMEAVDHQRVNGRTIETNGKDFELGGNEKKLKVAKEASEQLENNRRSGASRATHKHKGHEKRVRVPREVCDQVEKEKKYRVVPHSVENEKKPSGADVLEKHENMVNVQHKESRFEGERAMNHQENQKPLRETNRSMGNETIFKESCDMSVNGRRQRQAVEQIEKEKKVREALEQEDKERTLMGFFEKEENKKKLEEAHEREETERSINEAVEKIETEQKKIEVFEREESEKRLEKGFELEEKEKQQESERSTKEVVEKIETEKKKIEVFEREEREKKLKRGFELEENEKQRREACEKEENEKRLKEACEKEEQERKQKEISKRERTERRLQEIHDVENTKKRLNETHEKEVTGKGLGVVCEQVNNCETLKEAQGRIEESEMRSNEAFEKEKSRNMSTEARVETEKRFKDAGEAEGLKEVNRAHEQNQWDEYGQKLKMAEGPGVFKEREDLMVSGKAHMLDDNENLRVTGLAGQHEENSKKGDASQGAFSYEGNIEIQIEYSDGDMEAEAVEITNILADRKSNVLGMAQDNLKHEEDTLEMKGVAESLCEDHSVKASESGMGVGQEKATSCLQPDSGTKNQEKKFANEREERGNNFKQTQVEVGLNQKLDKDKFIPTQLVKESTQNGRKMEAAPQSVFKGKRNIQKTSQLANASQNLERKEKNINETLTSEDKEAERMKRERDLEIERIRRLEEERERERERDLEIERIRRLEEEREREREREKDRMAVDLATLEARERAFAEARERAERAAVERATSEVRQRALAEARERLEKACAEAKEKSLAEKTYMEARIRAERAAVERATVEARERAAEKAAAERAAFEARERVDGTFSEKFSSSRNSAMRPSSSSSDLQDQKFQNASPFSSSRNPYSSASYNAERTDGIEGESAQRCKARLERHRRTAERAAKALAEKNMRDLLAQREQAERNRLAETLDADVKRWSSGKEGNLRALLSTLQYILGPDSGWHPIPLTEVITSAAVKKAYRKATLCVHPDKLQQRGASIQQKYICEKVFDLLKEAWNKFNSEER